MDGGWAVQIDRWDGTAAAITWEAGSGNQDGEDGEPVEAAVRTYLSSLTDGRVHYNSRQYESIRMKKKEKNREL